MNKRFDPISNPENATRFSQMASGGRQPADTLSNRHGLSKRNRLQAFLLTLLVAITCRPTACCADDWPVERGNAQGTGVAQSKLPGDLKVAWKKKVGECIEATAVVGDGVVFVGDADGGFHAVRLSDGETIWTKTFEAGFLAAAAVRDGHVFVGDYDGLFRCLDAKTGNVVWKFEANAEYYAGPNFYKANVLTTSEDGSLYCLDAATGENRWTFSIDAPLQCSPTLSGDHVALAGCDSRLHLVNVASGEEVFGIDIESQTGSTPAVGDGKIYFGIESGAFLCAQLSPPEIAWTYRDTRRRQPIRAAAAVTNEVVVYGSHGKQIYALAPKDGSLKWKFPAGSRIESSPVIVGQRVFVGTVKGRLIAIDLTTGKEDWQFNAGGGFTASPAVASNRLVIGNDDGTLYCFQSK